MFHAQSSPTGTSGTGPPRNEEFKRAIELNPDDSEAHGYYSWFLAPMGRKDEAVAEAKRSQQLDPFSSLANFIVGSALVFTRQWDPAIEQLRSAKELDPSFWFAPCFLGRAYEHKGRLPEAIAEFQARTRTGERESRNLVRPGTRLRVVGEQDRSTKESWII